MAWDYSPPLTASLCGAGLAIGGAALLAGMVALVAGQPLHVCCPLLLVGVIGMSGLGLTLADHPRLPSRRIAPHDRRRRGLIARRGARAMRTEMNIKDAAAKSPVVWNAAAWFGAQLGGSAWALTAAVELLFKDAVSAAVCLVSFVALNAYGLYLWRSRDKLTAYGGWQRLLAAFTVFCETIFLVLGARGIAESHAPAARHRRNYRIGTSPCLPC